MVNNMVKRFNLIITVWVLLFIGCGTMNVGQVPWTLDIQNWSQHQKANFFMNTWMAEKANFDSMNTIEDKSDDLVKVLKAKREILESLRVPIRIYSGVVEGGGIPSTESEQVIINLLRQLQQQIIYK